MRDFGDRIFGCDHRTSPVTRRRANQRFVTPRLEATYSSDSTRV
jgi:hypothetical protein